MDDLPGQYVNVSPFSIFTRKEVDGEEFARITNRFAYAERNIQFSVRKPDITIRIFLLGGSACAGWPHKDRETFSTYLRNALQIVFPKQKIEIINAAAHGFASFRVRHIFDEVIEMDPDAIIIYSGNNEFLEKREYPISSEISRLANRLKTVQWLRSKISKPPTSLPAEELQDVALFFWKKVKRQSLQLRQDTAQFEKVQSHYRHTIEYMARTAAQMDIPVLLSAVPVNLRDWLPTVSHNRLTGNRLAEWQQLYDNGLKNLLLDRYRDGLDIMAQAIQLEPEHAESYFWYGRLLEMAGHYPEALQNCSLARDLDYNPFRAISTFNDTLRTIAQNNSNVFLLDLDESFIQASRNNLPGFDLFLDYVHPNTDGNIIIARSILNAITDHPILPEQADSLSVARGSAILNRVKKKYNDTFDLDIQTRLFYLYAMNHQYDSAIEKTRHIYQLTNDKELSLSDDAWLDVLPPKIKEGYLVFQHYQNIQRKAILGNPIAANELTEADKMLNAYYDKWYSYGKY